jgi:hypothetical protein
MTFKEYTKQRIKDSKKIQDIFPENILMDIDSLEYAYIIEEHLNDSKYALEKFFKRKLTWLEVDSYSNSLMNNIKINLFPVIRPHLNELIKNNEITPFIAECILSIEIRKKFSEMLGIEFEKYKENYAKVVEINLKNAIKKPIDK